MRLERLIMQALAEDIISEKRAEELLGKPLNQFQSEVAKKHEGLPVDMHYRKMNDKDEGFVAHGRAML